MRLKRRSKFCRYLKSWQIIVLFILLGYLYIFEFVGFPSDEDKKLPETPKFQVPKINAMLSKNFPKGLNSKGEFGDLGEIGEGKDGDDIACVPFTSVQPEKQICIYDVERDNKVSKSLSEHGHWDADQMHDLQMSLSIDDKMGLIDIGANLGTYTLVAAASHRKVVAVDACHSTILKLKKSIEINDFTDTVSIIEAAVTTRRGFSFMFIPHGNAAGAYPHPIPRGFITETDVQNHRVTKNILLDDMIRFITFKKAVLKIDIGGNEPTILAKSHLLNIIDIPYIFMAFYLDKERSNVLSLLAALRKMASRGYVPKRSRNDARHLSIDDYNEWPSHVIWQRRR